MQPVAKTTTWRCSCLLTTFSPLSLRQWCSQNHHLTGEVVSWWISVPLSSTHASDAACFQDHLKVKLPLDYLKSVDSRSLDSGPRAGDAFCSQGHPKKEKSSLDHLQPVDLLPHSSQTLSFSSINCRDRKALRRIYSNLLWLLLSARPIRLQHASIVMHSICLGKSMHCNFFQLCWCCKSDYRLIARLFNKIAITHLATNHPLVAFCDMPTFFSVMATLLLYSDLFEIAERGLGLFFILGRCQSPGRHKVGPLSLM